ncbi:hypothetical protein FACS1894105_06230 [Clostridia bacterium]|nr:hypothetical protein FACS1894105_06230 [Clostridia bacterium]
MTFAEELEIFADAAVIRAKDITNEAGTSISLVLPFLELLNYDTRNPLEVCPEYGAGYKGAYDNKRVDFAVLKEGLPIILVEVKWNGKPLNSEQCGAQLFQYFAATGAQFAIFTNGLVYRFYTDTKKSHIMDDDFFIEIDLEDLDVVSSNVIELFKKESFNASTAKDKIAEYNSARQLKKYISRQLETFDDDEFIRFFVKNTEIYNPHKLGMSNYRNLVKQTFEDCITEFNNIKATEKNDCMNVCETDDVKDIGVQMVVSAIKEMFKGKIYSDKLTHWKTKNGITVAYFDVVICRLFFYENGELYKMIFLTSDDTYPRKNKRFYEVDRNTDFAKFQDEFAEQIEQVKHWIKRAAI